jgi:hypothetical protein
METEKKPYRPPVLTIYGKLDELTKEGGNVGDDGFSGSKAHI